MQFFKNFKAFINKGNIVDLATAVVIGGAFGKIISSLVNDIIMPLISMLFAQNSIESLKLLLKDTNNLETNVYLNYGLFIQNIINFLIIALCIFIVIQFLEKIKPKPKPVASKPALSEVYLKEILEILQKK